MFDQPFGVTLAIICLAWLVLSALIVGFVHAADENDGDEDRLAPLTVKDPKNRR